MASEKNFSTELLLLGLSLSVISFTFSLADGILLIKLVSSPIYLVSANN